MNDTIDTGAMGHRISELFEDHGHDYAAAVWRGDQEPLAFGVGAGTWQALVDAVGPALASAVADRREDGAFVPDEASGHLVRTANFLTTEMLH